MLKEITILLEVFGPSLPVFFCRLSKSVSHIFNIILGEELHLIEREIRHYGCVSRSDICEEGGGIL